MPAEGPGERPVTPLTPAQDERVRRLLAEARHEGPMPAGVAARLDAVLADLAAEEPPADPTPAAPVVDLAARRRRRRFTQVLVAAAAVTVIGVGAPQLLGGLAGVDAGDDSAVSTEPGAEFDAGGPDAGGAGGDHDSPARAAARPRARLAELKAQDFPERVADLRDRAYAAPAAAATGGEDTTESASKAQHAVDACRRGADWPEGRRLAVVYDGDRGVLIFRQPRSGQQEVDLFLCGQDSPSRITVLPAP